MSINIDPCYNNIIGLSRTDCECRTTMSTEYAVSDSGYFIDELEGMNLKLIDAIADCDSGSLWKIMETAKENAIKDFKSDVIAAIMLRARVTRKKFIGEIADLTKVNSTVSLPEKPYLGAKMMTADVVGGVIKVKAVGLFFNQNTNMVLSLYKLGNPTAIGMWNVEGTANSHTIVYFPEPVVLPMAANTSQNNTYYWIFQRPSGVMSYNTKIHCGCGGDGFKPYYDEIRPMFESSVNKHGRNWADWIQWTGVNGTDLTKLENFVKTDTTNGLTFLIETSCDAGTTICNEAFDYESNPYAVVAAKAIQYRAGYHLVFKIKTTEEPSRYALLSGEDMVILMNTYAKRYKERIQYLADEIAKPGNINMVGDCLTCVSKYGFKKALIEN